jgi:L-ribulose-5-phosphate 4-epimerase
MGNYDLLKAQVLTYSKELVNIGYLKGTGGNFSVRVEGEQALAITPSNQDYLAINEQDICVYDFEKKRIEGELKPSIEMGMHIGVYLNRPDVACVIHTHQVYASALALINAPIPSLFDEQVYFLGSEVEIVPYAPSGTESLVENIVSVVGNGHNAYIMQNHGVLILGLNPKRAFHNMLLLEKCALAYLLALCTGEKVTMIPEKVRGVAYGTLEKDLKKTEQQLADYESDQ